MKTVGKILTGLTLTAIVGVLAVEALDYALPFNLEDLKSVQLLDINGDGKKELNIITYKGFGNPAGYPAYSVFTIDNSAIKQVGPKYWDPKSDFSAENPETLDMTNNCSPTNLYYIIKDNKLVPQDGVDLFMNRYYSGSNSTSTDKVLARWDGTLEGKWYNGKGSLIIVDGKFISHTSPMPPGGYEQKTLFWWIHGDCGGAASLDEQYSPERAVYKPNGDISINTHDGYMFEFNRAKGELNVLGSPNK
jgi:hypothetical protein